MLDPRSLPFTPVLPPDVCWMSVYLDTPVRHREPCLSLREIVQCLFHPFTRAEIHTDGIRRCQTEAIRPHLSPRVDNVPYY